MLTSTKANVNNFRNLCKALQDLLIRSGADKNYIKPIKVSVQFGSKNQGQPYTVSFYEGHHVIIGETRQEAYNTLQAMQYMLKFQMGL